MRTSLLTAMQKTDSNVVRLNVGGKVFTMLRQTLLRYKSAFFEKLLSTTFPVDDSGAIFLDKDPDAFSYIARALRSPEHSFPILIEAPHVTRLLILEMLKEWEWLQLCPFWEDGIVYYEDNTINKFSFFTGDVTPIFFFGDDKSFEQLCFVYKNYFVFRVEGKGFTAAELDLKNKKILSTKDISASEEEHVFRATDDFLFLQQQHCPLISRFSWKTGDIKTTLLHDCKLGAIYKSTITCLKYVLSDTRYYELLELDVNFNIKKVTNVGGLTYPSENVVNGHYVRQIEEPKNVWKSWLDESVVGVPGRIVSVSRKYVFSTDGVFERSYFKKVCGPMAQTVHCVYE